MFESVALFGLGGSGLATAQALKAGGADVVAWDDNAASVDKARAADIAVADLRDAAPIKLASEKSVGVHVTVDLQVLPVGGGVNAPGERLSGLARVEDVHCW